MRDPNRIDGIIAKLTAAWKKHPDIRLGQLVHLACVRGQVHLADTQPLANVFFTEDDRLDRGLDAILEGQDSTPPMETSLSTKPG